MSKVVEGGRGKNVLVALTEGKRTTGVKDGTALRLEYEISESRYILDITLRTRLNNRNTIYHVYMYDKHNKSDDYYLADYGLTYELDYAILVVTLWDVPVGKMGFAFSSKRDSQRANMIKHAGSSSRSNLKGKGKDKRKNDKKSKGKSEYLAPKARIVNPRQANMMNDDVVSDVCVMIFEVNLVERLTMDRIMAKRYCRKENRTLKEMVTAMLISYEMSQDMWGEAILTATYLLNKIPRKEKEETPYELWMGRKPSYQYLRVWGYLAKDIQKNTVMESRNSSFFENIFPCLTKETGSSSRLDDEVVQDKRQRDENDLQVERQDQVEEDFDTKYLDFAAEPNVRLGLATDGFNPFRNLSQFFSMWPVILTTYNFSPWLCMKESSFMLTLLILGPKSSGKDIDVYLSPLIDDLKDVWAKPCVETLDVATGQKFNMRAMVLWTILIFLLEVVCLGGVGKKPHKWRRSLEFNGESENEDPPIEFNRDAIMTQLARLPTRVKGKHLRFGGVKIKRNVLVELNWTKRSIFYELDYWSFHTLKHNLNVMYIEKNVLESILNTLLMNDKSKDTAKARQDLKSLGIQSGLWLVQNKNEKCSKPQAAYSFTPEDRKKFCQFIKGVKLPDGFGSNFKHKVTDNDTNITGLKSHDCHIMMQRLLPYGLQQYLPSDVAKPLIELCLFFKQICSQTLMVDDMLKAQSKVIDILCNLELIYPPAFFDIMIHLVIHLPLEAIFGGPVLPWWMYQFKRYRKKLKNYVRNKAKPEGSIAEGYVTEEALTFSSHYFWDVTTKFNRPDRNVDFPPPTCQFQVFKSPCKSIGLRSVIRIDHQELKKVICEFPNKDMKKEFPGWFEKQIRQRHVDNDAGVNESSELFALACGPSQTPISVNSYVVNGVRFVVHSRDERRTTQNSGICSPGPEGEMYYEDDPDVIHVGNSSDLALFTSLNDLEIAALHIDGQSIDVDAPPDIIGVVYEDDDIIDEEDPIPHDLADSDDEDLVNLDIDDGVNMSADVARGHGGDGGGDDRPIPYHVPTGCGDYLGNRNKSDPVPIRFEVDDRETLMPLGDHAAHWANYLGELVRELPLHYPSWCQMPPERKAGVVAKIGNQFDLRPYMESDRWPQIYAGIQQHLQKIYNDKKVALKERYWVPEEDGTYDLERIRCGRPSHISEVDRDAQLAF
uniref:DUF4218 domain-containing protein n=1 Tax=Tanacetum cinerariifolium TaxID=118510 RepID=A0A699HRW4_TANCI|nr:hypothetical protein [Tanacetum cinerariifolium]